MRNSRSACHEIRRLSCNPKLHCHVHSTLLFDPNLSQINPIHTHTPTLLLYDPSQLSKLLPMIMFYKWSVLSRFSNKSYVCIFHFSHACYVSRLIQSPLFYNPNDISCKAHPTVVEHCKCEFKIHSRHRCVPRFLCLV